MAANKMLCAGWFKEYEVLSEEEDTLAKSRMCFYMVKSITGPVRAATEARLWSQQQRNIHESRGSSFRAKLACLLTFEVSKIGTKSMTKQKKLSWVGIPDPELWSRPLRLLRLASNSELWRSPGQGCCLPSPWLYCRVNHHWTSIKHKPADSGAQSFNWLHYWFTTYTHFKSFLRDSLTTSLNYLNI